MKPTPAVKDYLSAISDLSNNSLPFTNKDIKEILRSYDFYVIQSDVRTFMTTMRDTQQLKDMGIVSKLDTNMGCFVYEKSNIVDAYPSTPNFPTQSISAVVNNVVPVVNNSQDVTDIFHRKIEIGDYITYPVRQCSWMVMSHGVVKDIVKEHNGAVKLKVRSFTKECDNTVKSSVRTVIAIDRVVLVFKNTDEGSKFTHEDGIFGSK